MRTFATRSGSKPQSRPAPRSAPILSPTATQSHSTAEREATQTATRAMNSLASPANSAYRRTSPAAASQTSLFATQGQTLDLATRLSMESRFRYDFSHIPIPHDPAAQRAASSLNARAFAHGRDIAFAKDQFSPSTAEGQRLLAHELAHTIQQAQTPNPVIRRSPNLHGATYFGDSDAPDIDKAIAASPIKNYIKPKDLVPLKGNFKVEDPESFKGDFKNYGKSKENVDEIPGFVFRGQKSPIRLRGPGKYNDDFKGQGKIVNPASFEVAVHETVHLNSKESFQAYFGHPCNEGVTEYYTEQVLGEAGKAYRDQLTFATGFMDAVGGEKTVGDAYFIDPKPLFDKASVSFGVANQSKDFRDWKSKMQSDKPADWKDANQKLKAAIAHPAPPQAPPKATAPPPATDSTPPPAVTQPKKEPAKS